MSEKHRQPQWAALYLALPLAGALFWLIQRMHPAGSMRPWLMIAVLGIVGGYVEAWRLANRVALLYHPLTGGQNAPIYYARLTNQTESSLQATFVTGHYDDLFAMPVYIGEPLPPVDERAPAEEAAPPQASSPAHTGKLVESAADA